jgi:RNA polymerase sigma factor (sigma-70 family)
MSTKSAQSVVRYLRKITGERPGPSDAGLLARFVRERDAGAYAALLERHGPMVLGVCRRILGNRADAEDAFQATFFSLARSAARLRPDGTVAGWLHAVARRTARKALARRKPHVALDRLGDLPGDDPFAEVAWRELRGVLDEELNRLPERLRGPLVLCYLDGLTRDEAAQRLGWSLGTLKRRLEEGRALLRGRLARRGLAPALLAAALTPLEGLRAAVPQPLHAATLRYGAQAAPPASVAVLAGGGTCFAAKAVLLATLLTAALAGAFAFPGRAQHEPPPPAPSRAEPVRPAEAGPRVDPFGDPLPNGVLHRFGSNRFREANHMSNSAITTDGRFLAVGSWNGITVFDLETGKRVRQLKNCDMINSIGGLSRLALSPDGTRVAHLMNDFKIAVRDPETGKTLYTLDMSPPPVQFGFRPGLRPKPAPPRDYFIAALFSIDGKELIAVGRGQLYFHDAATGLKKRQIAAPGYVLAVTADRQRFAAVSGQDKQARVVIGDMQSGKALATFPIPRTSSDSQPLAFSPDGQTLAAVVGTARIRLWDAGTGRPRGTYEAPEPDRSSRHFLLQSLAFTPDGRTLFAGSHKRIFRWDTTTGTPLPPLAGHLAWYVWGLYVTPDGKRLVSVGDDCTVRRWELPAGTEVPLPDGYAWYTAIAYAPDGRTLAVADGSGRIDLCEPATGKVRQILRATGLECGSLTFTPDGKLLATGHADGAIHLWDTDTAAKRRVLRPPSSGGRGAVSLLAFSPDGRRLLSGAAGGPLRLWDLAAGNTLWERSRGKPRKALFGPDGKTIAVAAEGGPVVLLDASSGAVRRPLPMPKAMVAGMTFAAGGRILTTAHDDGVVRCWETATGRLLAERKARGGWEVSFSPDGRWFVCADNRNTVYLHETATGKEVWRLDHDSLVIDAVFAPDGRRVLTATRANAYLWTLRLEPKGDPDAARLWADLTGDDAASAYRAAWALAEQPGLACRMLRDKVGGPEMLDVRQVEQWLRALDSKAFAERERASRELAARGRLVERLLRNALAKATSLESSRRIEAVLRAIPPGPTAEDLGQQRALQVLELIGNADARAALQAWAGGSPGMPLTEDATAALARLARLRE